MMNDRNKQAQREEEEKRKEKENLKPHISQNQQITVMTRW